MRREYTIKLILIGILAVLVIKFGVMAFFQDNPKNTGWAAGKLDKNSDGYDVIVVGEEPEGIAAALSAARMGAKTLLISEGEDLGGTIAKSLRTDFEINLGTQAQLLDKGIMSELYYKLGSTFSVDSYKSVVKKLVEKEKRHLEVVYGAKVGTPVLENNTILGVNLIVQGEKKTYKGKRVIDATWDGKILRGCDVPFFAGSEDFNMKDSFLPLRFNFLVSAPSRSELKRMIKAFNSNSTALMDKYQTSDVKVRFGSTAFYDQGGTTAVISGLEAVNVNPMDANAVKKAYNRALTEAKTFTESLKSTGTDYKNLKFEKPADSFYIREQYHFAGEHTLSVNEQLDNTNFKEKIALGSYPVDASKFADGTVTIVGRPIQYSIPLGCILPLGVDNLLMVGSKASYSSLAATSAGTTSVSVAVGEAAGAEAVFTLTREMTCRQLLDKGNEKALSDYQKLLRKQKVNIPNFTVEDKNAANFSYDAVRQLRNIGLISAGYDNNYYFTSEATQADLALLLLNGVYRLSPSQYTLELDSRIRKYFIKDKLTRDKAGEILLALYGGNTGTGQAYQKACERGYISDDLQARLNGTKALKLEDVYSAAAYNLKVFTGKDLIK